VSSSGVEGLIGGTVQSKLEDVLQEKGQELKLYQRFLDLKSLCEKDIFPDLDLPIGEHTENLKNLVEKLIPDPRDRKEEMFSGEIFVLLGTIYLHDMGLVEKCKWYGDDELFDALAGDHKKILITNRIGRRLDIPDRAMEIINYISFSDVMKKIPREWEITEDHKKALVRNAKVIGHIFNFSHLMHDVFYSDLSHRQLRRYRDPVRAPRSRKGAVDINSREGIIRITLNVMYPYELHQLESARAYVENAFRVFKNGVNGRLGFQYKELRWDVTRDFDYAVTGACAEGPRFSPYTELESPPLARWKEAATVLDRMFELGHAMVVGEEAVGKTTVLRSFVLPQIMNESSNAFYCELWENPVREIRDAICRKHDNFGYSGLDIVSICNRLLEGGPCFFLLDNCERVTGLERREREKFERFLNFCFTTENVYLIVSGGKEDFFEWFSPFKRVNLSAICEIEAINGERALDAFGEEGFRWDRKGHYKPVECHMLHRGMSLEGTLQRMSEESVGMDLVRAVLASLMDMNQRHLKRFSVDAVCFETCIERGRVLACLKTLKEWDMVNESELDGIAFFSLSNRYVKEPLYRLLDLGEFEEKKSLRSTLRDSVLNESYLDAGALKIVRKWKDSMVFSREAMGLILSSLISLGENCEPFLTKAKRDFSGIDIQPILRLVHSDDAAKRRRAIRLLGQVQDKNMINPLIKRLMSEDMAEIRDLLMEEILRTGKKRAITAVMRTLKETGDSEFRLRAIQLFHSLYKKDSRSLLLEIKESEEDPKVAGEVERLLSMTES
jgi:hypothetical protein